MSTEKLTKILLGIIAIALWMLALHLWLQPMPVSAGERVSFTCKGKVETERLGVLGEEALGISAHTPTGNYLITLTCD